MIDILSHSFGIVLLKHSILFTFNNSLFLLSRAWSIDVNLLRCNLVVRPNIWEHALLVLHHMLQWLTWNFEGHHVLNRYYPLALQRHVELLVGLLGTCYLIKLLELFVVGINLLWPILGTNYHVALNVVIEFGPTNEFWHFLIFYISLHYGTSFNIHLIVILRLPQKLLIPLWNDSLPKLLVISELLLSLCVSFPLECLLEKFLLGSRLFGLIEIFIDKMVRLVHLIWLLIQRWDLFWLVGWG